MKSKIAFCAFGLLGSLILESLVGLAHADYPTKPITLMVQYSAGGSTDLVVRKMADLLEKDLKNPVIVVNKLGGGGTISMMALKNSKPDGYTLGTFAVGQTCLIPHLRAMSYNAKEDFTPLIQFGEWGLALGIKNDSPWNSVKELIEYARQHPEELNYGTTAVGSPSHLSMEQLALQEMVKMKHVPFQGGAQVITALMGGHIKAALVAEVAQQSKAGNIRALAVVAGQRMKSLPNIPTFQELGYKIEAPAWVGLATPKGVPQPILQILEKSLTKVCADPTMKEILYKFEMLPTFKNREDFTKQLVTDYDRFGNLIKELNIRTQ